MPQDVAEMYLELVGLYGTATPVTGTITVQGPDTIRVLLPDETVAMVGPPQMPMGGNNLPGEADVEVVIPVETTGTTRSISTHQSGNKRHAPWNDESECPSIDTMNRSVSNNTQLTGVPWKKPASRWSRDMKLLRRSSQKMAEMDNKSETVCVAALDQTSHPQLPRKIPRMPAAKRQWM